MLPEPKTSALNSVRGFPEQPQASNADGAGFAWSGCRTVSKVGCDVRKMRKPERGRFLRQYGHTTCSHAGPRRGAETERKCSVRLMSCRAEADSTLDGGEAEDNEDVKATRVCRFGVACLVLF